jgi:hypothetical protein
MFLYDVLPSTKLYLFNVRNLMCIYGTGLATLEYISKNNDSSIETAGDGSLVGTLKPVLAVDEPPTNLVVICGFKHLDAIFRQQSPSDRNRIGRSVGSLRTARVPAVQGVDVGSVAYEQVLPYADVPVLAITACGCSAFNGFKDVLNIVLLCIAHRNCHSDTQRLKLRGVVIESKIDCCRDDHIWIMVFE